jgi:tRNA-specific 2-thiouridylase
LGADAIATGHYARLTYTDSTTRLLRGIDANKDQSYFLHAVASEQLAQALFPVGEMHKPEVRRVAESLGLVTHDKKDSTGICFIGERRFKDFLQQYLPAQPGEIRSPEGQLLGRHEGLMYYTLGQRQGLHIGGVAGAIEAPWYVAEKRLDTNTLIAVQGSEHPRLMSQRLWLEKPASDSTGYWVDGRGPTLPYRCTAKTRYRQADQACLLEADGDAIRVTFDKPQWAVTPGQSAVFYADEQCLGGAVIERTEQAV